MSGTKLPPALLLGGELMAVSAARSLARMGVAVHAVGDTNDPVQASRACSRFTLIRRGPGLTERYLKWLQEHGPRGAVILPCDDESLEVVALHRRRLESWGYRAVEADDDVLLAMLDKERTYELASAAGVLTPRTMTLRSCEDAVRAADLFDYPCALKPLRSHMFSQAVGGLTKLYVVNDAAELLGRYQEASRLGIEMLVTDIIPGGDDQFCSFYSYLLPDGTPLFQLTKHKLRQLPIGFGLTCYQETLWEPEVAAAGMAFFKGVGLRGVGNVEFKRDPRDGQWKVIECNHRFTRANEIIRLAGVDVPVIAYRRAAGLPVAPVTEYRRVRMWNPLEDAKAFLQYRAVGELTTLAWVRSLLVRWHLPMFRFTDPTPTLVSVRGRVPGLVASLRRRRRRSRGDAFA